MADIELNTTATVATSATVTVHVYEDTDGDGVAENSASQVIDNGTNEYVLSGFQDASGNDWWVFVTRENDPDDTISIDSIALTPTVSPVNITADGAADGAGAATLSPLVSVDGDGSADGSGAATLKPARGVSGDGTGDGTGDTTMSPLVSTKADGAASGHSGNGLRYVDQGTDAFTIPAPLSGWNNSSEITVSAWIETPNTFANWTDWLESEWTDIGAFNANMSSGGDHNMSIVDSNENIVSAAEIGGLSTNTVYHLVGVYDGTDLILYRDGNEVARTNVPGETIDTTDFVKSQGQNNDEYTIDDVRMYDRALSPSEITALNEGKDIRNGLVFHLDFEDRSDETTAADTTANGNDAIIESARYVEGLIPNAYLRPARRVSGDGSASGSGTGLVSPIKGMAADGIASGTGSAVMNALKRLAFGVKDAAEDVIQLGTR